MVRDLLAIDAYQPLQLVGGRPRPPSERVPIDFLCPALLKVECLPTSPIPSHTSVVSFTPTYIRAFSIPIAGQGLFSRYESCYWEYL
ncbi:unnamed protein product [Dibothriocephalus latus]|uniref:Uncharacterized protein n=1 Tax=Dibothriocephalus latus TaxID=60516 RepID=A0A3P6QHN0_DIBLA|nr:unnamed protein product [Dibothriocephalus latus]